MFQYDRRLLHVDADPHYALVVQSRLATRGFETTPLQSAGDAMDYLSRHGHRVVLLGLGAHDAGGLDLLREIKRYDGGVQVVMLIDPTKVSTVLATMRAGAEACFFKPLDNVDPLVDCLDDVFAKIDRWWSALHELTRRRRGRPAELTTVS